MSQFSKFGALKFGGIFALALAGLAAAPLPALAQSTSRAVVQALPGPESQALNSALSRLGRNPKDVVALIDAGNAALAMGDVDAAVGFFANADSIQPNSPRVRAGLAAALVQNGNPYDAIPLFTEAEGAGGMDPRLNADRGLAYDLVGDNATAQKYYRLALAASPSDEVKRRLALSLAIAGNRTGMEEVLMPLLQKADKPAYRTRAFALAILGKPDEAVTIAYQSMPQDLAVGISPYLRYMPRLTKAQQAAAATFGHFPRAADIGRDDPRVLRYSPPVHVATAEGTLVPVGKPLGKPEKGTEKGRDEKAKKTTQLAVARAASAVPVPQRAALPDFKPAREETVAPLQVKPPVLTQVETPPARQVATVTLPPAKPLTIPSAQVTPPATALATGPALVPAPSTAPATLPPATITTTPKPTPAPAPAIAAAPPKPKFFDAFGDLGAPTAAAVPASGAVDIRKIAAAKAQAEAKVTKPSHPSRIWIQVGVGRGKGPMQSDWKSLVKDVPELLRGKSASTTDWGKTNRLLTGPFETESAAKALLAKLKKQKVDAFVWTSPAGQVVDPL
ncbi:tetratricopeptide repeat protein [Novosphingobium sp.]|uniref:tetratricopeptide repeat protein n=1 Tax=Novosphingobium sp. TaxID=1874826 RepID=UPI00286DAA23|nr:tetratricopeptide repeat protein [Novosphingobium sp.]